MRPPPAAATRILVYGVTGSGKTTLAERIARRTGLPWHSVDDLTWEPGWVQVPLDVQRARIAAICQRDRWILDSAYAAWKDIPLARAQLVVGLDFPRWVSLVRLLRRTVTRVVTRESICNGNREQWSGLWASDSLFRFHVSSFGRKRRRMRQWQADPTGPPVLLFRSPRAVDRWLDTLG